LCRCLRHRPREQRPADRGRAADDQGAADDDGVGWLFIAVAGPQALLSPFCGRIADRFDRRALWIGCDATSAVLALGLPLWLACGGAQGPGIYTANLALAVVSALFFRPVRR